MKRIIAAILLMLPGFALANTYTAVLEWDVPTQYEDGTPLAPGEILGYTVHYGTTSGSYSNTLPVGAGSTSVDVSGLSPGTWYFALTVTSTELEESDYSAEVSAKLSAGKPKKPVLRFRERRRALD